MELQTNKIYIAIILSGIIATLSGCPNNDTDMEAVAMDTGVPFTILSTGTQKCLSALDNDSRLSLSSCEAGGKQHAFEIVKAQGMAHFNYNLKSLLDNKCVELSQVEQGTDVQISLANCNNSESQRVIFYRSNLDYQYFKLRFSSSDLCLDIQNPSGKDFSIGQDKCKKIINQDLIISKPRVDGKLLPTLVWTFWDKGESQMPEFYKANVAHWREILGAAWSIRVLNTLQGDENYYGNFINSESTPDFNYIKSKIGTESFEKKLNPAVIFSDFLRLELLHDHGGFWIDPSVILHNHLQDIKRNLESLENYNLAGYTTRAQATFSLRYADSLENFFLAAIPETEILKTWKTNFRKYWDLKTPGLPISQNPLFDGSQGPKVDVGPFRDLADYLNQHVTLKYTLMTSPELKKQILVLGGTDIEDNGPFYLLKSFNWSDRALVSLSTAEIKDLIPKLDTVLISKFPSENSRTIRDQSPNYFYDSSNLFGHINEISKSKTPDSAVNRVVWGFWDQGEENLPAFNKYNVNHWRHLLEPLGYKIRILNLLPGDPNEAVRVLGGRTELPSNFDALDNIVTPYKGPDGGDVKMVPAIVKSDAIRLAVLEKFGGVWMDTSNVLLRNLDELIISDLNNSDKTVAGYIMQGYSSSNSPVSLGERVDGMENWFIAAKRNSPLIKKWREAFVQYWETRQPGQWISDHEMYKTPGFSFGGLGKSAPNYLNQHAALKYVLHHYPFLGQEIYPVKDMQPWWLHARSEKEGKSTSEALYEAITSREIQELATDIKNDNVGLLKFAGPHLTEIKQNFPTIESFCTKDNLISLLFEHCP